MNLIHKTTIFTTFKHNASKYPNRKGTNIPYITHPMEVTQILSANNCSEKVIVTSILHDRLENTSTKPNEISEKFSQDVLEIIKTESKDKSKTWEERKQSTILKPLLWKPNWYVTPINSLICVQWQAIKSPLALNSGLITITHLNQYHLLQKTVAIW